MGYLISMLRPSHSGVFSSNSLRVGMSRAPSHSASAARFARDALLDLSLFVRNSSLSRPVVRSSLSWWRVSSLMAMARFSFL